MPGERTAVFLGPPLPKSLSPLFPVSPSIRGCEILSGFPFLSQIDLLSPEDNASLIDTRDKRRNCTPDASLFR